ncbi:RNA polymerase II transcription mediator isoform X2 [Wolffia australiana]
MAAELGQKTVDFSDLVRRATEDSFLALRELVDKSKAAEDQSDSQRKIELLKYIFKTRQRMLRLHVLAKWCQQVPLVQYCQQLAGILSSHDTSFTQAADSLFFTHEGLQQARAPVYDVPSAVEVLLTGSYRRLPKCIEDLGIQATLPDAQKKPVLQNLDTLLRSRLLEVDLPKEVSEITVSDGTVLLRVEGEFKVLLTLGYRGHLSLWRILHLELLIGEKSGSTMKLEELRRYALGDDLERRMASTDKPFTILYSVLHELCISLVMDTVVKQVQLLRQGRWKDAIRFELISDDQDGEPDSAYQKPPGVKITYWVDFEKMAGVIDSDLSPFIKIEAGSDLQIKCVHSGFVIDPVTEKEAEFVLDRSCIDVEGLLLRATACNTHTRLLEIQRDIIKFPQIFQSDGDVILKSQEKGVGRASQMECLEEEVLYVRAYGSVFITLGVNIRSGRFLLQSSKNVTVPSALSEGEEALNQGTMSAAEVFIGLRSKSIMHLFASIGKFRGLKVYERDLITLKIPRSIADGSDLVLMEFSQCGSCYYLLLHLDRDLRPLFKLLETQPPSGGTDECKHIIRYCNIDISRIAVVEDDMNLSPLNWDTMELSLTTIEDSKQNLLSERVNSPSSFSSVVDQLFEVEKKGAVRCHSIHKAGGQGAGAGTISPKLEGKQFWSNNLKSSVQSEAMNSLKPSYVNNLSSLHTNQDYSSSLMNFQSDSDIYGLSKRDSLHAKRSQSSGINHNGDERAQKRSFSDITSLVSSADEFYWSRKIRKIANSRDAKFPSSSQNKYVPALLLVIRHCALYIKHAQVTSQMDALEIPFVEEVSLVTPSSNLWFRLPFGRDDCWEYMCLSLGKLGTMSWHVEVNDSYFTELWELQKGNTSSAWGDGVRIANVSDNDSHICIGQEGVVLNFESVEVDSIKKLVSDLRRLSNARSFARGMRELLGVRSSAGKLEDGSEGKQQFGDRLSEQTKRAFKIEAVGPMGLHFCYGAMPVMAHFVVEWEAGKEGCTMRVPPDQLWPHTKFLEDFIDGGEVALFLDCIRLTAGPLLALANAIRPARMPGPVASPSLILKQTNSSNQAASSSAVLGPSHAIHNSAPVLSSVAGRGGPGIVPSSLLPFDVAVVLRGPYYIRIIYRKKFAVDMRCFAGDQVWLQPATPPKGGVSAGGSLPCPQFRPFIMEHVAQGLNALEPGFPASGPPTTAGGSRVGGGGQVSSAVQRSLPVQVTGGGLSRAGGGVLASSSAVGPALPLRVSPTQLRGELNTAFFGPGDDGGYGGSWVPLAALKKVLRGILKYLGVLWLFSQLPELLKEILGSIFKENEGGFLNQDQEQPALRFFVGGYVFSVSVHRVQLLLQIISVKRVHLQQQQQQQPAQTSAQEELAASEIAEICEYFSRRVTSEPYDISRVSSFITLLTLPIAVLREFLKLISWEKGFIQSGEPAPLQRARIELSLENHSTNKPESDIRHDRARGIVDFGLTFVLDPTLIPHTNAAGGATWLPYCVAVRLRYAFGGDTCLVSLMGMEGSHGGRACWARLEDWEKCKLRVVRAVEFANSNASGENQGRLRSVAESLQKSLQQLLQQLREGAQVPGSTAAS